MTDAQLERCRKRLEQFLVDLLEPVGRSERRHWGSVYVRGLLLDGERKSVEPMAKRLPDGNEQAMQQFVGQSPWEWQPVWERLARRMVKELEPDAIWVIKTIPVFLGRAGTPLGWNGSILGRFGKTANCQVAVSLHEVCTEGAGAVLSWRLYLPESWANDPLRLAEAGVPGGGEVPKEVGTGFVEMIDQARGWKLPGPDCGGRCGLWGCDGVSGSTGDPELRAMRSECNLLVGVWVEPPRPRKLKPKGPAGRQCVALRQTTAGRGQRSGTAGPGLEESSLAGRQ